MLDCTPDIGDVEQMTIIIRFVILVVETNTGKSASFEIREHFLGFRRHTGAGLTKAILGHLQQILLALKNLRGQGCDNGSSMKGKVSGAQRRILDVNPRAMFVSCSAHALSLVVNDSNIKTIIIIPERFGLDQSR